MEYRAEHLPLERRNGFLQAEHTPHFEQTQARLLARAVVGQGFHQTRQQGSAHHRQLGAQGIGQCHGVLVKLPFLQQVGIDECVVDGFLHVHGQHLRAHRRFIQRQFGLRHQRHFAAWRAHRNMFIADDAGDFLDQVLFDGDIEAAARRHHLPAFGNRLHTHAQGATESAQRGHRAHSGPERAAGAHGAG